MRFTFTRDNLKRLTAGLRPVVKDGQMVGVTKVDPPKAYIVSDDAPNTPPGLCLYVGSKRKTFYLQIRVGGKVTRVSLGDYPRLNVNTGDPFTDVRQVAMDTRLSLKRGEDIQQLRSEEREIVATTLGDVMNGYLEEYKRGKKQRPNTIKAIEAAIQRLEPWLDKSLRSIGSSTVFAIWDEIAVKQKHRTAAEQTMMWCRAAFNVHIKIQEANKNRASFDHDLLVNPFKIAKDRMRTRAELESEYQEKGVRNPLANTPDRLGVWLDTLWSKRQTNRDAVDYMLLTLLTGARKSETAQLVWRDRLIESNEPEKDYSVIELPEDGEQAQITFRGTKSGATHSVPIGRFATQLMRMRYEAYPDRLHVFPASSKNPATKSKHYNSPREFVASLRSTLDSTSREQAWGILVAKRGPDFAASQAERENFDRRYKSQWMFTMHDLRRTFCTVAVNIEGMPYAVVQQLMNHSQMSNITARYGKPTLETLRRYMQKLEDEILRHATTLPKLPWIAADENHP